MRYAYLPPMSGFFRKQHKADRGYPCWEQGSHLALIVNEELLRQKLDYIHHNPVKRR
ncbi:MAG: hypothetical protein ACRERV_04270 [Methylococcales bacterium]